MRTQARDLEAELKCFAISSCVRSVAYPSERLPTLRCAAQSKKRALTSCEQEVGQGKKKLGAVAVKQAANATEDAAKEAKAKFDAWLAKLNASEKSAAPAASSSRRRRGSALIPIATYQSTTTAKADTPAPSRVLASASCHRERHLDGRVAHSRALERWTLLTRDDRFESEP
eukprot:1621573-Pleurochrysis_carterae.AAC.1